MSNSTIPAGGYVVGGVTAAGNERPVLVDDNGAVQIAPDGGSSNVNLATIAGTAAATGAGANSAGVLRVTVATDDALTTGIGALTETAPGTDTASSGLNGRLQRIAQRITSLIALVPASIGQKAKAASFAVTIASDDNTLVALGAPADAAVSNPASSASVIAALKGIMTLTANALKTAASAFGTTGFGVMGSDGTNARAISVDTTGHLILSGASVATASLSAVASSASSQQALAANTARLGLIAQNDDANAVYVKFGTTASATDYTVMIPGSGGYFEMPRPIYTGRIDAIWAADGSGSLRLTEL